MKWVYKGKKIILSFMILFMVLSGIMNDFANVFAENTSEKIEIQDAFDSIVLEDEQVPLHFVELEKTETISICLVHWTILFDVVLATLILFIFRKGRRSYIVELLAVALIAVILCFKGNCSLDWIFAVVGTIWLEIMNIIFNRKYDKENMENH